MSLDQLDQALAGGGAPSAFNKDSPIGASVTGTIVNAEIRQITDYVTQKPKTWDDGRPQMNVVITLQTDQRDPDVADDDGQRRVFIKTWGVWRDALNAAIKAAGGSKASDVLTPGARFTATFTETRPSSMGSPMKVYAYKIEPAAQAGLDAAVAAPGGGQAGDPWATQQQAAPVQQQEAPAQQQAAAPVQPAAAEGGTDPAAQAKQAQALIGIGLSDDQIAAATGLDPTVIQAIRANAA